MIIKIENNIIKVDSESIEFKDITSNKLKNIFDNAVFNEVTVESVDELDMQSKVIFEAMSKLVSKINELKERSASQEEEVLDISEM